VQHYKNCGDFQKALYHSEMLFTEYRQLHNDAQNQTIQSLVARHQLETMQKDAEIYRLKNNSLQAEIKSQQKARESLQQIAVRDHLTGLHNRYYFFELAEASFQKAVTNSPALSIIMVDLDNFKNVNDEYGHVIGDIVLKKVAETLLAGLRSNDVVARYGGDEFIILLSGASNFHAEEVAERLRRITAAQCYDVEDCQVKLSCSVGIAHYDSAADLTLEGMIRQADTAMYEAKQSGGDCVRVFGNGKKG